MDETHETAGESQEVVVEEQAQEESDAVEVNSASDQSDPWAAAFKTHQEFEEADSEQPQIVDDPAQEQEDESKSHFEQDKPKQAGDLNLEKLAIPHKFKDRVKEFVGPLISERQREVAAVTEQLGQHQEATVSLVNVLKDIALNPSKLPEIVEAYGESVGLDQNIIQRYKQLKQNSGNQSQAPRGNSDQRPVSVDAMFDKYAGQLVSTDDPNQFVGTLKSLIAETIQVSQGEMQETIKQMLGGYHEQFVSPTLQKQQQAEAQANFQAQKSTWNNAQSSVKEKYKSDFSNYEKSIIDRLKSDPRRLILNKNPKLAYQNGITHESLIEEAYLIISRNDHIKKAKQPAPKQWTGGLKPSAKFTNTTKTGTAGSWDKVRNKIYG